MTEHSVLTNPCTSGGLNVPCNTPGGKCCRKVLVLGKHEEYPPCPDPDSIPPDPCCQDPTLPECPDPTISKRITLTEVDDCTIVGDRGVFVAPLWLDVYEADQEDPDSVLPAGVYKKFCCCEQWLQVLSCQDSYKRSIKLTCGTEFPCRGCKTFGEENEEDDDPAQIGWNPCTESLTLDNQGSDCYGCPEGDCFYTPIFGTEDAKDSCGDHAANWVIKQPETPDYPLWGCDLEGPAIRNFIFDTEHGGEHDIEVINTETYDDDDLCAHFCDNACYSVYKSCGNCINPEHEGGFCLSDRGCVTAFRLYAPLNEFCSGQLPNGSPVPCQAQQYECHEKIIDGLTPNDVITNPWLRNMEPCIQDPISYGPNANPCMHCANYHYRKCPSATCVGGPGNCAYCATGVAVGWDTFHQPPTLPPQPGGEIGPPNFARYRSCNAAAPDGPYCASCDDDPIGGLSCYTLGGVTDGRRVEYLQGGAIMPALNCDTQRCENIPGDTDPGQPPFDDCDCQEHPNPPRWNCIDPHGLGAGVGLRELPRPFQDTSSFFPTSITANVFVEHEFISKNVELSFVNPTKPKEEFDQDIRFAMLEMNHRQFELISETTPISEFATTGGYATKDVPKVSQAIFLGLHETDTTKHSIWLNASPLISFTNSAAGCRTFTFNYTLFSYCSCGKYDKNCNCEEFSELLEPQQTVTFHVYLKKDNG